MTYVIRSMSTTDFSPARRIGNTIIPAQVSTPYHVFLKDSNKRAGAFWAQYGDIAKFETEEEAEAEAHRSKITSYDIVPVDFAARGLPNYWDARH